MNTNYPNNRSISGSTPHNVLLSSERDITEDAQQKLSEIGAYIEEILSDEAKYVDDDIYRISSLIHDAMEQLQHSFSLVMMKTNSQSNLIARLVLCLSRSEQSFDKDTETMLNSLSENADNIKQEINRSICALQFEDISKQLTDHIQKRLEHINDIALVAHTEIPNANTSAELNVVADRLRVMRDDFRKMNIAEIVRQHDLSEGDIELF
ncbi:hypothetical protein AB835_06025 [Candidatus Endobugula sertula]|uniref:Chemotaxis protein CheZ n=1 Tax=Candidatus Endobugula sertula TaxID=62101 RepID=A0A1D2QQW7_9GAMM|nr:hypothetical protein AB835_06025 [Candidatus Endobugula sertula]